MELARRPRNPTKIHCPLVPFRTLAFFARFLAFFHIWAFSVLANELQHD